MSNASLTTLLHISLDASEASVIANNLATVRPPLGDDNDRWVRDLRFAAYHAFPRRLIDGLEIMRRNRSADAGLRISGLPVDPALPRTPKTGAEVRACGKGWLSESILIAAASLIGEPYAVTTEADCLVSNLIPLAAARNAFTGLGSSVELGHHIENAALRLLPGRPDLSPFGLMLISVRDEPNGGPRTLVADGRAALARVQPSLAKVCFEPRFSVAVPNRWLGHLSGLPSEVTPTAIVLGTPEWPVFAAALYGDLTRGLDEEARDALAALKQALKDVEIGVRIEPGECVYVSNVAAFHAREAFDAGFDADGHPYRWLQRVFITTSLDRFDGWNAVSERLFEPKG